MEYNNLDMVWVEKPETVKKFLDQKNDYEQLCGEIGYILKKKLIKEKIEFSSVLNRAKTLKSFIEKIQRKTYDNPFTDITDFAGVRVVFLYQNDLIKIESIIKKEFNIIEKVDKLNDKGIDKFGYGAIHYIVKIGNNSTGARYDDLKDLVCEIQVRTVLQDAWAIIDHHLVYKNESEIPTSLQRKLNSLAGLFETADNQFDVLRQEREKYLEKVVDSIQENSFLENELNLDTFLSYLTWKFPKMSDSYFTNQASIIFGEIQEKVKFQSLEELDKIVEKHKNKFEAINSFFKKNVRRSEYSKSKISSSMFLSLILAVENIIWAADWLKEIEKNELSKLKE